jgi:hypothetical protein
MKSTDIHESLKQIMEEEGIYRVSVREDRATWGEIGYLFTLKLAPIGESGKFKVVVEGISKDKRRSDLDVNLLFSAPRGKMYEGGFYSHAQAKEIFEAVVRDVRSGGLRNILDHFHPIGAGMSITDLVDLYRDPR